MKIQENKIYNIDCLKGFKELEDSSVDCIVTDPPYGLSRSDIENDESLDLFYKSLQESHRVLKSNKFFITFFSTKFLPRLFEKNPFNYFWQVVLYCPEGRVKSPVGYTKYMSCFVFSKGKAKIKEKNKDIFEDTPGKMIEPDEGYIDHPTPKPKHFIKKLLKMFTEKGDLVLDPFIGSGSTAVACKQLERNYIGFEVKQEYFKIAKERLSNF